MATTTVSKTKELKKRSWGMYAKRESSWSVLEAASLACERSGALLSPRTAKLSDVVYPSPVAERRGRKREGPSDAHAPPQGTCPGLAACPCGAPPSPGRRTATRAKTPGSTSSCDGSHVAGPWSSPARRWGLRMYAHRHIRVSSQALVGAARSSSNDGASAFASHGIYAFD